MSTHLTATCPGCQNTRPVPAYYRGQVVRCKACDTRFVVLAASRRPAYVAAGVLVAAALVAAVAFSSGRKPALAAEPVAAKSPVLPPAPAPVPAPAARAVAPSPRAVEPRPTSVTAPVAVVPQKRPAARPPAPKADPRKVLDRVKESVAVIKGKYGHGSGFLVAPDVIATNSHVILSDMVQDLSVRFPSDGLGAENGLKVTLLFEHKARDLVLLRLDKPQARPVVPVAAEFDPQTAPLVYVVGSPAQGQPGLALSNAVEPARCAKDRVTFNDMPFYCLDYETEEAAVRIGPGNSGGPAVNAQGQLIGVVTMADIRGDGRPNGRAYCIPAVAVRDALAELGPADGWAAAARKATALHAYDIAMTGLYLNTVIGSALVEVRMAIVPNFVPRGYQVDWAKVFGLRKDLVKLYRDIDKELSKITQPAVSATILNPDLTQKQRDRLRDLNNDMKELRRIASNDRVSDYEARWAVGCEARGQKAFAAFRDEGKMPVEFLIRIEETLLRKVGVEVK